MLKKENNYSTRIKEIRRENGKTQQEIADYLNLSRVQYIQHEQGRTRLPADIIVRLSKYFNVSCDYLLGLSNKKSI